MKICKLLLIVAFLAAVAAVNGKNATEQQTKIPEASMPMAKPTAAPLMTSTVPPTKAAKIHATPTKPIAIKTNNATKKSSHKKMEIATTEKTVMISQEKEPMPLAMPATVETNLKSMDAKPLAVTGFITQNGNVYEIEDSNGMGKIQGRQAEEEKEHVCNYGAVVIYSDVPCSEVNNVQVSGVEERPALDEKPQKEENQDQPMEMNKPTDDDNKDNDNKESEDEENLEEVKPTKRRPNNRRRNRNKKKQQAQLQQQKKNKNRRNNQKNGLNRPNNRRRPLQQRKRRQQQMKRQQQNRRQNQNQRKRNQRRNQQKRRQQAQRLAEE